MSGKGVGLVLSGGGGKGAYHIGVWKALRELSVDINIKGISGTSVGALNTVLFAQGDYYLAEGVWKSISSDIILKLDFKKLLLKLVTMGVLKGNLYTLSLILSDVYGGGLFSREGLLEIIDEYVDLYDIKNNELDLFATAYNINTLSVDYLCLNNREIDSIKKVLLATSALPIIFDKEKVDGNVYIDGGVKDNIPIKPLYDKGFRTFIVVHLNRNSVVDKEKFKDANIIEIVPSNDQGDLINGTLDFSKEGINKRIDQGYNDALKVLKPIYEMGLIQAKLGLTLHNFKKDEFRFRQKKEKIIKDRKSIKSELDKLLKTY